jgi:hypothetical protein
VRAVLAAVEPLLEARARPAPAPAGGKRAGG